MQFVVQELAGLDQVAVCRVAREATADVVEAIFDEGGQVCQRRAVAAQLYRRSRGAQWQDGDVATVPKGRSAYKQFVDGGWNALSCDPEHGGLCGSAAHRSRNGRGNVEPANISLRALSDADPWRHRSH